MESSMIATPPGIVPDELATMRAASEPAEHVLLKAPSKYYARISASAANAFCAL
jgi:hypothetical protein